MSVAASRWAWNVSEPLSHGHLLVLLVLADRADESGVCWPSQRSIARQARVSGPTVVAALKALEAAGLITREAQHRENGSRRADRYQLAIPGVVSKPTEGGLVKPQGGLEPSEEPSHEPSPLPSASPSARGKRKRRNPTLMADDWMPDDRNREYAHDNGLDVVLLVREFRAYWISRGTRRADWQATFRNHITRQIARLREQGKYNPRKPLVVRQPVQPLPEPDRALVEPPVPRQRPAMPQPVQVVPAWL